MNARKVILDCDPGIDDALALMLALSLPGLDVVGITVVCGNVPVEKGVKNALKILELMNRTEIGVYAGEETPLIRPYVDAMDTHGRDGLGESGLADSTVGQAKGDAVRFLADILAGRCFRHCARSTDKSCQTQTGVPGRLCAYSESCVHGWYIQSPRKLFPCSRI